MDRKYTIKELEESLKDLYLHIAIECGGICGKLEREGIEAIKHEINIIKKEVENENNFKNI